MRLCVHSLGVRSTRFSALLAQDPGRDPTLERQSPEAKAEASFDRSCLSFTSWRALGPCLQACEVLGTTLRRAEQLRCHATTHAMPAHMSASKRSAIRHLAFRGFGTVAFASVGRPVCPFHFGTEGHLASTTLLSRRREGPSVRFCLLESPASTTLLHGSTLAESTSSSARYGVSSLMRAARRGLASSPTGARPNRLLPLGSRLRAEIVGSSPNTSWSPLRDSRYGDTENRAPALAQGPGPRSSRLGDFARRRGACALRREADRIVRVGLLPTTRTHRDATSREGATAPQRARGAARRSPLWRGVLPVVSASRLRRGSESPFLPRPLGAATRLAREMRGSTCFGYRLGGSQRSMLRDVM
jgi:hypothetical protein